MPPTPPIHFLTVVPPHTALPAPPAIAHPKVSAVQLDPHVLASTERATVTDTLLHATAAPTTSGGTSALRRTMATCHNTPPCYCRYCYCCMPFNPGKANSTLPAPLPPFRLLGRWG